MCDITLIHYSRSRLLWLSFSSSLKKLGMALNLVYRQVKDSTNRIANEKEFTPSKHKYFCPFPRECYIVSGFPTKVLWSVSLNFNIIGHQQGHSRGAKRPRVLTY